MRNLGLALVLLLPLGVQGAKKTFVYCSEGSPTTFNPQITVDGVSANASAYTVYNRLVDFKYGSTATIPSLATKWDISRDQKTYTFYLRKGVKFHRTKYFTPTRNFNADDVLFSFNRQWKKEHPYHRVGGASYDYWKGMGMGKLLKSLRKIDDYTIELKLNRPEAPLIANMAMGFMSILSKEYADRLAKEKKQSRIDHYPVGTGPFIFKKYVKDNLVRYSANEDFWQGRPKVDNLVFSITPDASVRYQKLKTGECHLIIEPAPADIASMQKNENIKVLSNAGLNIGYLAMNTAKKPFDNILVRKAVNHALNKESYIKAIYLGRAIKAVNAIPPKMWSYNKDVKDYSYNPDLAKKLLAKAGYPKGFATEIWTLPVTRPYNPNGKKMGEMMQADLAAVGIKAKLITYDWPTYLKKSRDGTHSLIQLGWFGDNGDPDNFLNVLLGCPGVESGSNTARWCNKKFNRLVVDAKRTNKKQERIKLYKKAQWIFKQEAPWVTIAHAVVYRAMSSKVTGYKIDPFGGDKFTFVDLK